MDNSFKENVVRIRCSALSFVMDEDAIWINAADQVLSNVDRPLHYTEIKCEILRRSLVIPG